MHDGSGCKASSKINESHTVKYFNNFFLSKKKMDVSVNVTLIHHAQIQMNKKPCSIWGKGPRPIFANVTM